MRHLCQYLQDFGWAPVINLGVVSEGEGWILEYRGYSTGEDVRDGEAERLGEVSGTFSIGIKFCPFCGAELLEKNLCQR